MHKFYSKSTAQNNQICGDFGRTGKSWVEKTKRQTIIHVIHGIIKCGVSEINKIKINGDNITHWFAI